MIHQYTLLFLIFLASPSIAQEIPTEQLKGIYKFVNLIKKNDRNAIAKLVSYPLYREYPIPAIKTKEDFLNRFDEIFDSVITKKIYTSIQDKSWFDGGWRGVGLGSGDIWLYEGKLFIINYQSQIEKELLAFYIAKDKESIPSDLQNHIKPILKWETAGFIIRIDQMEDESYRYSSWKKKKTSSDTPDLVLHRGEIVDQQSSMGNLVYGFTSGNYTYLCFAGNIFDSTSFLKVQKDGETILNQDVLIDNRFKTQ